MENKQKNKLTNKIIITLLILIICRLGIFIPIPGINHEQFNNKIENNNLLSFLNIFSGGGFATIGIFALGIIPYINSSIVIQLLIKVIPELDKIQKDEGERGKQKINQITRFFTLLWSIIQSYSIALLIRPYTFNWNNYFIIDCILTLTSGSMITMWFSEIISEYGIGNGASLLIFQNIISNIPKNILNYKITDTKVVLVATILAITILMLSILIQESKRKINIISSKELGQSNILKTQNYIPIKINQGGVMPIVFASATITLINYINQNLNTTKTNIIFNNFFINNIFYYLTYASLIIVFSYFYASIILNTNDISKNLKKMGASIPNIRPGSETINYLNKIINKLTFIGSIFLFMIAQLPYIILNVAKMKNLQGLGATSLLILVGVAIDTSKQLQTYIISQQYDNIIE
uniref:Protein translocase subunit SecY n=1 Tax=Platysiphonia delicata TaxID=2006979 RepID=A0A1Z1M1I2_9FLOR|nr:SecY-type transporter protein [Platysiphonia delicata]ARW59644.1 SecY-type transporter protein [Platysiphonia delicata]